MIAALPMDLVGFGYAAFVTFGSIVGYKRRGKPLSSACLGGGADCTRSSGGGGCVCPGSRTRS